MFATHMGLGEALDLDIINLVTLSPRHLVILICIILFWISYNPKISLIKIFFLNYFDCFTIFLP